MKVTAAAVDEFEGANNYKARHQHTPLQTASFNISSLIAYLHVGRLCGGELNGTRRVVTLQSESEYAESARCCKLPVLSAPVDAQSLLAFRQSHQPLLQLQAAYPVHLTSLISFQTLVRFIGEDVQQTTTCDGPAHRKLPSSTVWMMVLILMPERDIQKSAAGAIMSSSMSLRILTHAPLANKSCHLVVR